MKAMLPAIVLQATALLSKGGGTPLGMMAKRAGRLMVCAAPLAATAR